MLIYNPTISVHFSFLSDFLLSFLDGIGKSFQRTIWDSPRARKALFTISPQSCLFSSLLGWTIAHLEYFVLVPSVQINSPSISLSESPIHAFRFNLANWDLHECVQQEVVFLLWFNIYQVSSGFFARPHQRHAMFYSRGTIWSTSCQTISTLRNILKWVAKPGRKDGAFCKTGNTFSPTKVSLFDNENNNSFPLSVTPSTIHFFFLGDSVSRTHTAGWTMAGLQCHAIKNKNHNHSIN